MSFVVFLHSVVSWCFFSSVYLYCSKRLASQVFWPIFITTLMLPFVLTEKGSLGVIIPGGLALFIGTSYLHHNKQLSPHIFWAVFLTTFIAPLVSVFCLLLLSYIVDYNKHIASIFLYSIAYFIVIRCCLKKYFHCDVWIPTLIFGIVSCAFW